MIFTVLRKIFKLTRILFKKTGFFLGQASYLFRSTKRQKIISYYKGVLSEYFCMFLLVVKGYKILGKRIKTKFGEIDVLATKNGVTVVFEAKYRSSSIEEAKFALLDSRNRVKKAYISLKRKGPVEFRYFVQSGFRFQFGSMH
jgi:hypothetical protein